MPIFLPYAARKIVPHICAAKDQIAHHSIFYFTFNGIRKLCRRLTNILGTLNKADKK